MAAHHSIGLLILHTSTADDWHMCDTLQPVSPAAWAEYRKGAFHNRTVRCDLVADERASSFLQVL